METSNEPARADALAFLKRSSVGVLAYVTEDGAPHASTVYYTTGDDFSIYFMTTTSSRKYVAIKKNPGVAFTVGSYPKPQTVQLEGEVEELESRDEYERRTAELTEVLASNPNYYPPISKLGPNTVLLRIRPKWIRWSDFAAEESAIFNEIPTA